MDDLHHISSPELKFQGTQQSKFVHYTVIQVICVQERLCEWEHYDMK